MSVKVNALDHLVINVADVARSAEWYRRILGMEIKVFDPGPGKTPRTSLLFGSQKINMRAARCRQGRHAALGLLPGSRRQLDRDFVV